MDDLIDLVENHAEYVLMCESLVWIFDIAGDRPDPRRVALVDTTVPVIITQMADGRMVVLDGLHRLAKTVVDGSARIRVKFINEIALSRLAEAPIA